MGFWDKIRPLMFDGSISQYEFLCKLYKLVEDNYAELKGLIAGIQIESDNVTEEEREKLNALTMDGIQWANQIKGFSDEGEERDYIARVGFVKDAIASVAVGGGLPAVTTADNGKGLLVKNGAWAVSELPAGGGTETVVVSFTTSGDTISADMAASQIYTAAGQGKIIVGRYNDIMYDLAEVRSESRITFARVIGQISFRIAYESSSQSWNFYGVNIAKQEDIPKALKNPYPLVFTGAATGSYDGSEVLSINIPENDVDETPIDIASACDGVIAKVRNVIKSDSIISLTMSDAHQLSVGEVGADNVRSGNAHAGIAAKYIAKRIPLTFAAYLGDYTTGNNNTTTAEGKGHFSEVNDIIAPAFEGVPNFRTVGNHDDLHHSATLNGANLPTQTTFAYIGVWNNGGEYGDSTNGYCYRDIDYKKLRIICLNTDDGNVGEAFTTAQQTWFKNALKDVGSRVGWNVIILSHHPLDWGAVNAASNILYDYHEGTGVFEGSNNARVLLALHGHVHCYKYDQLNRISDGACVPYGIYRMATPNMCFNRNNEYGRNGTTEYFGIEFGESATYDKIAGTTSDTAFTVNVINPSDEMVYSYHYGAGYDREFSIAESSVSVTGVSISPNVLSLEVDSNTTLTVTVSPSNATNKTVTWASSAPNIASVSNGVVTGVEVGNAVITATTVDGGKTATCQVSVTQSSTPKYTNIVPTLVDSEDTTQVFNGGLGYKNGAYASSVSPGYNSDASFVCTGMIPTVRSNSVNTTWYIKGVDFNGASHSRLAYGTPSAYSSASNITDGSTAWNAFTVTKLGEKYYKVVQNGGGATHSGLKGWWFSAVGSGENLIVTKNEPIE